MKSKILEKFEASGIYIYGKHLKKKKQNSKPH